MTSCGVANVMWGGQVLASRLVGAKPLPEPMPIISGYASNDTAVTT